MQRFAKQVFIATTVVLIAGLSCPSASAEVSFGFSYSNLSPHGSWLVSAEYGRVWQPSVYAPGWNPYYDGHWIYTDLGWTWVSDYEWGAIPYHYGTWVVDPGFGWVWVPGTVWAPSWVVFRTGPDCIGWAPVPPRFTLGLSFGFSEPRSDQFVYVSARHFLSPRIRTAVVRDSRRSFFINHSRMVNNIRIENNFVVNRGPDVALVEKASGRRVHEVRVEDVARIAPGARIDRAQLRVNRRGWRLQAAEPVSEREPLPSMRGPETRRSKRDVSQPRRDTRLRRTETRRSERGRERRSSVWHPYRDRRPAVNAPQDRRDRHDAPAQRERTRRSRPEQEQRRERKHNPEHGNSHGDKPPAR